MPDPLLHVQVKKRTAEHIPEGFRKEGGQPEKLEYEQLRGWTGDVMSEG